MMFSMPNKPLGPEKLQNKVCSVCNAVTESDEKVGRHGGLVRCCERRSVEKMLEAESSHLKDPNKPLFQAAKRLNIRRSWSKDLFAIDVYYHNSCYCTFTRRATDTEKEASIEEDIKDEVWRDFSICFERALYM